MPTEINLPTVGPLPNASKGDDEYTLEDIARRVQLTVLSGGVSYPVPLLGHGPHVVLVLSEVAWPIGTECSLTARVEHPQASSQSGQFNCPKGVVIGSYNAILSGVRRHLVFVHSESSLAHFFLRFDKEPDGGRFVCFAVPEEVVGILDDTGHAYYLTDSKDRTVFISKAELEIAGCSEMEVLGRNREQMWWEPKMRADFLERLKKSSDMGSKEHKCPETVRWKKTRHGERPESRWLTTTSVRHTDTNGVFLGIGGVYSDTTELEALRRTEGMASVIKTFSHQLISPIVNVSNLARNIADGVTPVAEAKRVSRSIAGLAQAILHFYPRLRLLEKMLNQRERAVLADRVWIKVHDFLSTVRNELSSYAESRRLTIRVEHGQFKNVWLRVDPSLIKQAFLSVMDNAIKYGEETSTIQVTGELSPSFFHIFVGDRGIPLKGQYLDRIFQEGFRTPEAEAVAPGTGHGLWLAQSIMVLHGAKIVARGTDRSTGFTTFDLQFPNNSDMVREGV